MKPTCFLLLLLCAFLSHLAWTSDDALASAEALPSDRNAQVEKFAEGATYSSLALGIKGDGSDETKTVISAVEQVAKHGGGTIKLAPTGRKIVISSGPITWPGNVNVEGCGKEGSDLIAVKTAGCGFDLRWDDPQGIGKIRFFERAQTYWHNVAVTDDNPKHDCTPFFFITNTVVDFDNVSINGTRERLNACNDVFVLGANIAGDKEFTDPTKTVFGGYGSTFHHIFTSHVRRIGLLQTAANGTDWEYIFGDGFNGCGDGKVATCSAIEVNAPLAVPGAGPYGNVFSHLEIEQGNWGGKHKNYKHVIDFMANTILNAVFFVNASDFADATDSVHIGKTASPELVVCGFPYYNSWPGCVSSENQGSFADLVIDPATWSIKVRTLYTAHLGTAEHPIDDLNLSTSNGSITGVGAGRGQVRMIGGSNTVQPLNAPPSGGQAVAYIDQNGVQHPAGLASSTIINAFCMGNIGAAPSTYYYLAPFATGSNNCDSTSNVPMRMPRACRARNLHATGNGQGLSENSCQVSLVHCKGSGPCVVASNLTCRAGTRSNNECSNTRDSELILAGEYYAVGVKSGTANDGCRNMRVSFECE